MQAAPLPFLLSSYASLMERQFFVLASPFREGRSSYNVSDPSYGAKQTKLCLRYKVLVYDLHCHWLPERVAVLTSSDDPDCFETEYFSL